MLFISDQPDFIPPNLTVSPPQQLWGQPACWRRGYHSTLVFIGKVYCGDVPVWVFGAAFDLEMESNWTHGEGVIVDYFVRIGGPRTLVRFSGTEEGVSSSSRVDFKPKSSVEYPWYKDKLKASLRLKKWPHLEGAPLAFCGVLRTGFGEVAMKHFSAGFDLFIFCCNEERVVAIWEQPSNRQTVEQHEEEEADRYNRGSCELQ